MPKLGLIQDFGDEVKYGTTTLLLSTVLALAAAATQADLCRQYDGAYISYYEHVFLVKGCQRHTISTQMKSIR